MGKYGRNTLLDDYEQGIIDIANDDSDYPNIKAITAAQVMRGSRRMENIDTLLIKSNLLILLGFGPSRGKDLTTGGHRLEHQEVYVKVFTTGADRDADYELTMTILEELEYYFLNNRKLSTNWELVGDSEMMPDGVEARGVGLLYAHTLLFNFRQIGDMGT